MVDNPSWHTCLLGHDFGNFILSSITCGSTFVSKNLWWTGDLATHSKERRRANLVAIRQSWLEWTLHNGCFVSMVQYSNNAGTMAHLE